MRRCQADARLDLAAATAAAHTHARRPLPRDLEAKGNIVDHEYKIERDGDKVAEVSKRWFRVHDTYGIEIAEGQNEALILAVAVCIDQMGRGE